MSPDPKQILTDRVVRLRGNLSGIEQVLARSGEGSPSQADLPGLAWLLQSSYSDFEEVLKHVALVYDGAVPDTVSWHRDLLDQLSRPMRMGSRRGPILSTELCSRLDTYRTFRHYSRNATFVVLEWPKLQPLVTGLARCVSEFEDEIRRWLDGHSLPGK